MMPTRVMEFDLDAELKKFSMQDGGAHTRIQEITIGKAKYPRYVNEFWTARQRQAVSLHEVAYRACFKPQLPRFFIERLTAAGDVVYDPFSGRGTTVLEAALMGRRIIANDINPLSRILAAPRLTPPDAASLEARLKEIPIDARASAEINLTMFYHPRTLAEIVSLREYLMARQKRAEPDALDAWIRMVATNRLTGHSPGFFSVYTLPPNQAVAPASQVKINRKRKQQPEYRDTRALILKKSKQLLRGLDEAQIEKLRAAAKDARFLTQDARQTHAVADASAQLTVTSPPFLDVVQYAQDNWLRCWFNAIDADEIAAGITTTRNIEDWEVVMGQVIAELARVTQRGGWVAFEVGEVRKGALHLDEHIVPLGEQAGLECRGILVNQQEFTKTANIWGVNNNTLGTNTNRVVVFHKD